MRIWERLLQPGTLSECLRFAKDAALLLVRREGGRRLEQSRYAAVTGGVALDLFRLFTVVL